MAITNALRYFPSKFHKLLAKEFAIELDLYGHIYMYRFKPKIAMKFKNFLIMINDYIQNKTSFQTSQQDKSCSIQ